jgi:hypothetical protein
VVRLEAGRGIDRQRVDLLRAIVGDRLDVHAAFCGGDEGDAAGGAIDQQSEVEFLGDVDAVGEVEAIDLLAFRPGLDRHQRVAEHLARGGLDLFAAAGEADAALGVGAQLLELALAAAARVDLRLDDVKRAGELVDGGQRFSTLIARCRRAPARRSGRAAPWPDIRGCSWGRESLRVEE